MESGSDYRQGFRRGLGFASGLLLPFVLFLSGMVLADSLFQFSPVDLISASQINKNFQNSQGGIDTVRTDLLAPIGSIVVVRKPTPGACSSSGLCA